MRSLMILFFAAAVQAAAQQPASAAPGSPAASVAEIQRQIDRGHADQALAAVEEAPAQPGLDRVRGAALYSLNRFPEADRALAAALKADPADNTAAQLRGLTLFRLGRPAEAIPLLERAHAWTAETKVDPAYVLALCYIDTRRYDDARGAFADQYGFAHDSAAAHLLAARMLLRREYVPIAKTEAERALQLDAQLPLAHELLGEVALAGEHIEEAIKEFETERARNPLYGLIYDRLGDAYSRKGDYPAAQRVLQQALLLEPNSTGPFILLGKVLLKRGDASSATLYLERAERMDPNNYMTHNLLGQAYRQMGRADEARRETAAGQQIQAQQAPKFDQPRPDQPKPDQPKPDASK